MKRLPDKVNPKAPVAPPPRGRPPGSLNKTNEAIRHCIQLVLEKQVDKLNNYIDRVGEKNPADAVRCVLGLLDFTLPRLSRQVIAGDAAAPVAVAHGVDKEIIARALEKAAMTKAGQAAQSIRDGEVIDQKPRQLEQVIETPSSTE